MYRPGHAPLGDFTSDAILDLIPGINSWMLPFPSKATYIMTVQKKFVLVWKWDFIASIIMVLDIKAVLVVPGVFPLCMLISVGESSLCFLCCSTSSCTCWLVHTYILYYCRLVSLIFVMEFSMLGFWLCSTWWWHSASPHHSFYHLVSLTLYWCYCTV